MSSMLSLEQRKISLTIWIQIYFLFILVMTTRENNLMGKSKYEPPPPPPSKRTHPQACSNDLKLQIDDKKNTPITQTQKQKNIADIWKSCIFGGKRVINGQTPSSSNGGKKKCSVMIVNLQDTDHQRNILKLYGSVIFISIDSNSIQSIRQLLDKHDIDWDQDQKRVVWIMDVKKIISSRKSSYLKSLFTDILKFYQEFMFSEESYQILFPIKKDQQETLMEIYKNSIKDHYSIQIQNSKGQQSKFLNFLKLLKQIVQQKQSYINQQQNQQVFIQQILGKMKIQSHNHDNKQIKNDIERQISEQELKRILISAISYSKYLPQNKKNLDKLIVGWLSFQSFKQIKDLLQKLLNSHYFSQQQIKKNIKDICYHQKSIIASYEGFFLFKQRLQQLFQQHFQSIKQLFSGAKRSTEQTIELFCDRAFNKNIFQLLTMIIVYNIKFKNSSQKLSQFQTQILKNTDYLFDEKLNLLFSQFHHNLSKQYKIKTKTVIIKNSQFTQSFKLSEQQKSLLKNFDQSEYQSFSSYSSSSKNQQGSGNDDEQKEQQKEIEKSNKPSSFQQSFSQLKRQMDECFSSQGFQNSSFSQSSSDQQNNGRLHYDSEKNILQAADRDKDL